MCERKCTQGQTIETGNKKFEIVEFVDCGKVLESQKKIIGEIPVAANRCVVDVTAELLARSPVPVGFVSNRRFAACELCQHDVTFSVKRIRR